MLSSNTYRGVILAFTTIYWEKKTQIEKIATLHVPTELLQKYD